MSVQLIHGDCLHIMPKLPTSSVQMVFADLPYGVTQCKWDSLLDLSIFWRELERVATKTACIATTATQKFAVTLICSNLKNFRYDLIWKKSTPTGFLNAASMPLRAHESILIFYRKKPVYNPQKTAHPKLQGKLARKSQSTSDCYGLGGVRLKPWQETGLRNPISILTVSSERRQFLMHPTQKPVALLEWLIKTYTNPGDTVLDPTAGSGTTAIAALRTGRKAICIEKDANYFEVMQKRVADEQAQMRLAV